MMTLFNIVRQEYALAAEQTSLRTLKNAVTTAPSQGVANMIRKAFRMAVNAGQYEEYERRHSPIWPALAKVLDEHGASNYSIFLDESDGSLFGYVEIENEERWNAIASTEVCRKWWTHMRDIMPVNSDDSPRSTDLREVFHLD